MRQQRAESRELSAERGARRWINCLLLALSLSLSVPLSPPAHAAGTTTGMWERDDCSDLANPVAYKTWCRDRTSGVIYVWDGTGYVSSDSVATGRKNVKDPRWGAKGDGVADDAPAINAALAAGGVVYMPCGTYKTLEEITFPTAVSATLEGGGQWCTNIAVSHQDGGMVGIRMADTIANHVWSAIRNLTIHGGGPTMGGPYPFALGHGIYIDRTTYGNPVEISGVDSTAFQGVGKAGFYFKSVYNSHLAYLRATANYYGLYSDDHFSGNMLSGSTFNDNVYNVYLGDINSNSNHFVGGEIGNGAVNIYCAGSFNEWNTYIENGGTTHLGVTNTYGPTIIFTAGSVRNLIGTSSTLDGEKVQDLGLGNSIKSPGTMAQSNLGALELSTPLLSAQSTLTNLFYDSSQRYGKRFSGGNASFTVAADATAGVSDLHSTKITHDGTGTGNNVGVVTDQAWTVGVGDSLTVSLWVKVSRDMVSTENFMLRWRDATAGTYPAGQSVTMLKANVWRRYVLTTPQIAGADTFYLYIFALNVAAPIVINLDDVQVTQNVQGSPSGPIGTAYLRNDATAATRSLTTPSAYSAFAQIEEAQVGMGRANTFAKVGGTIHSAPVGIGTDADTNEKVLASYSIPARALGETGGAIHFIAHGLTGNNRNNKTTLAYLDGTAIYTSGAVSATAKAWEIEGWIWRRGDSLQTTFVRGGYADTLPHSQVGVLTKTDTGALTLDVRGLNGTAQANDVYCYWFFVEVINY